MQKIPSHSCGMRNATKKSLPKGSNDSALIHEEIRKEIQNKLQASHLHSV